MCDIKSSLGLGRMVVVVVVSEYIVAGLDLDGTNVAERFVLREGGWAVEWRCGCNFNPGIVSSKSLWLTFEIL